jgi:hypothetical protein
MTGEAVWDHCAAYLHCVSAGGNVAGATREHGISRRLRHHLRMLRVGKPQIVRTGPFRSLPLDRALDGAVVTLLASR